MIVLLYFVPPFLAYRMGARGWWFWAIILFSWPAFVVWLLVGGAGEKVLRRREDAELKRTLMIVRAINPAMADKIEIEQAIERTLADAPKRKATRKPMTMPGPRTAFILAILSVATAMVVAPWLVPPLIGQQPTDVSLSEHADGVRSVGMPWHGRGE